jgi:hypothetical protein
LKLAQRHPAPVTADRYRDGDGPPFPPGAYDVGMTQHPAADSRPDPTRSRCLRWEHLSVTDR